MFTPTGWKMAPMTFQHRPNLLLDLVLLHRPWCGHGRTRSRVIIYFIIYYSSTQGATQNED